MKSAMGTLLMIRSSDGIRTHVNQDNPFTATRISGLFMKVRANLVLVGIVI